MYGIEGLLAGRTLVDRYLIEEVIGRGGMGAVYRARDQRLGREVAVKVISVVAADRDAHERLRARFQREARVAATLHHPNVVAVYDFGTDPALGLDFLVMELLRGEDLAARLARKGKPAPATALEVLHQATRGIAAGHRAGLVHRDVKPGNLFLEPGDRVGELQVKVLDFGIADITAGDELTMTHLTVGRSPYSPAYASPEQVRGETRLGPATDVFSLGAVGFHLLTGQRAFQSADPRQMVVELSTAVASELPRVQGLPPGARRLLERALSVDPHDRFAHAGEMAEALGAVLGVGKVREPHSAEPDDRTLMAEPPQPRTSFAAERTRMLESEEEATRVYAEPVPRAPVPDLPRSGAPPRRAAPPLPQRRESGFRRAASTAWNLLVTGASFVAFAAAWFMVVTGLRESDLQLVYAGAAASVLATPFAVHRLMGQQGSFRFGLFGSIVGTLGMIYLLNRSEDADLETVMGALFLTQTTISFLAELISRRGGGGRIDPTDP